MVYISINTPNTGCIIMKPFAIYHSCSEAFSFYQEKLVSVIREMAKPDMIFLLGASLYKRKEESIFNEASPVSQYTSDYFLLILIEDPAGMELYEWQDKIESHCRAVIPVTTIVLKTSTFEEWLKAGHRFAVTVRQSANQIYERENYCTETAVNMAIAENEDDRKRRYADGLNKACEFLAGAELFRIRKQNGMAAFMLHQSAEQSLRTMLAIGTGFLSNTHNIDRLIRYASLVSGRLQDVFPQRSEYDRRLLNLLQRAYADTRYKEEYKINSVDLLCLTDKVRCLQRILTDAANA